MKENTLDVLGLELVNYFLNFENYQPFIIPEHLRDEEKGKVYLINKNSNKYQIIKIVKQSNYNTSRIIKSENNIISAIKKEFALPQNSRVLFLLLNDNLQNELHKSPTVDVIIASPGRVIAELTKIFPVINQQIKTKYEDEHDNNANSDSDGSISVRQQNWQKINFQNRHFLKDVVKKANSKNLIVTWFFLFLLIITYVLQFLFKNETILANYFNNGRDDWKKYQQLFFGANTRHLIYGAHQYWRWLTYPFVDSNSFGFLNGFRIAVSFYLFYQLVRFVEAFYGSWKTLVILTGAIILTGIMTITFDYNYILFGTWPLILIAIGALIPIIWNYKLFKSKLITKMIATTLLFFFIWSNNSKTNSLLVGFLAIASGWLWGSIVNYHNHKITAFYAFSPIALVILLTFALLSALLTKHINYDNGNYISTTLKLYEKLGLISEKFRQQVINNYFDIRQS